jgi:hypothetical protein
MEVSGQLHAPAALPPGKEPQSRSGQGGEEKNSQPLPIIQPIVQSYTIELSRLLCFNGADWKSGNITCEFPQDYSRFTRALRNRLR